MTLPPPESESKRKIDNPVRIKFGRGTRGMLADEIKENRCLIVASKRGRREFSADRFLSPLLSENNITWIDQITANPSIPALQTILDNAKTAPDSIIAFGGGSVIDSAKALAVGLSDSLRGVRLEKLLQDPDLHQNVKPLRLYAIPTTAGTGSEVTPFATIWDPLIHRKFSLSSPAVYPHTALVDPELTDRLPGPVTLSTGLDAINQAAESIWNRNATQPTIELAMKALQNGVHALPKLIEGSGGMEERDQMAKCSLLAGCAISQTRTALCHSISYPLTAHFGIPHGLACAFTMLEVLHKNLAVDDGRFGAVAERLIGPGSGPNDLADFFLQLYERLEITSHVKKYIPDETSLRKLIDEMITPGRADNNLAAVTREDVLDIVTDAYRR